MLAVRTSSGSLVGHKMRVARAAFAGSQLPYFRDFRAGFHVRADYRRSTPVQAYLENVVSEPDARQISEQEQDQQATPQLLISPGQADRQRFRIHWSVDMWRDFNASQLLEGVLDANAPVSDRMRSFANTLSSALSTTGILGSSQAAAFWAYHTARTGFFTVQALVGLAAARVTSSGGGSDSAVSRMEAVVRNGWQGPLAEAFLAYYQDYENIKEGRYGLPWDMTTSSHRQYNPLFVLRSGARFVGEAVETLRRRERGTPDEVWLRSAYLPEYAQSSFHYQTDGWMSDFSAKVYPTSTETLFVGRQDAMQRSALVPISEFLAGKDATEVRALEIACGTGRFATFLKDNHPRIDLTLTDLSPFYLAEARSNMKYWKSKRAERLSLGGPDGNGTHYCQTAAEALAFPDASFDLVTCTYLFHELPADVRRMAVSEMARVVKPGGMVVFTDSVQLGDRPSLDATLGGFGSFNEPFYRNYIETDLGAIFEEAGLECDLKVVSSTTKTLSFKKPLAGAKVEKKDDDDEMLSADASDAELQTRSKGDDFSMN